METKVTLTVVRTRVKYVLIYSEDGECNPSFVTMDGLVGLVVRRPPRERKIPGSNPACAGIFSGLSHTSDFKNWHSSGYPARRLALYGQRWDWSARCQYTVTG